MKISSHSPYDIIKRWKYRQEKFGFLIYDPQNTRIYECDLEAIEWIKKIQKINYDTYRDLIKQNIQADALVNRIMAVFI